MSDEKMSPRPDNWRWVKDEAGRYLELADEAGAAVLSAGPDDTIEVVPEDAEKVSRAWAVPELVRLLAEAADPSIQSGPPGRWLEEARELMAKVRG